MDVADPQEGHRDSNPRGDNLRGDNPRGGNNNRGKDRDPSVTHEPSQRAGDNGPGTRARSLSRERSDARARDQGPPLLPLPLPRKDKGSDKGLDKERRAPKDKGLDAQSGGSNNQNHQSNNDHNNDSSSPPRRQKGGKGRTAAAVAAAAAAGGRGGIDRVDEEAQLLAELYVLEQRQQQKLADLSVYTAATAGTSASAVNLNSAAFVRAGVGAGAGVGGIVDDNNNQLKSGSTSTAHGKASKGSQGGDPMKDREKLAFKPGVKDHR